MAEFRSRRRASSEPVRTPHIDTSSQYSFRRSRTITGSTSSEIKVAGEDRSQLRSPRLQEHTLRRHRRRLFAYLVLSLAAAGGLLYVVTQFIGSASTTRAVASQSEVTNLDSTRYQALAQEYLEQHPLERFHFSLKNDALSAYIRAKAPEVAGASIVTGESLSRAELTMAVRRPIVVWTIQGKKYYVDESGHAFQTNYFAEPSVVVTDRSGITADAGIVASDKLLRFIGRVIVLVNASQVGAVEKVELPPGSARQVDIRLKDHAYTIKANLDRDPAGQAADIVNAVKYVDTKGIKPQYLDVRVSSKAYYR